MPGAVGVLALQGDFEAHGAVLAELGASVREVRVADDLEGLGAIVLPGGESTTMTLGIGEVGCRIDDRGGPRRGILGLEDAGSDEHAFGRQVRSFEGDVALAGFEAPFHAVFIRAPWVAEHASDISVLAAVAGHAVAVSAGRILAVAFHPELIGETRLHRRLLEQL